ncbi:unnamed protein product [Parnassius apollo]|uniref:(apollo) hypothetical protein n=1 Tax=Parnassius apollo TaxID=110799 RepID=A0A8S3XZD6_PARAO|nr:unnamed protein product [Parnassius apollo]
MGFGCLESHDAMGIPINDLKKKESLMAAFGTHLKKKKDFMRSGTGLDEIYTPSWPFFEVIESFLKDVYQCNSVINTEEGFIMAFRNDEELERYLNNMVEDDDSETEPLEAEEASENEDNVSVHSEQDDIISGSDEDDVPLS